MVDPSKKIAHKMLPDEPIDRTSLWLITESESSHTTFIAMK